MEQTDFKYADEKFADLQLLRYQLYGFETLSLQQKCYIYCLSKAALYGRDITFDQQGKYNLRIRKTLETVVASYSGSEDDPDYIALVTYLKRVWFSNGIYHHYGCEKFVPEFSRDFLCDEILKAQPKDLPLHTGESIEQLIKELFPVIFDAAVLPKRVNQTPGVDLVKTSACNFYEGVTQKEVEHYYARKKTDAPEQPSWGLNSKLVKRDGKIEEEVWKVDGMYGTAIKEIVKWLLKARDFAENDAQKGVIDLLVKYYKTGDLKDFDRYSIAWVGQQAGDVDFINGFIEVYGDPLGLKGTWEGLVEYKDPVATKRTRTISENAQWFEDHSPVDPRFRKPHVKGVTANAICAAMLGGDEYPSSAIGINLPNADWIRAEKGSKSVTISNLTQAYDQAAKGNGFMDEFVIDQPTVRWIRKYGDLTDDLHTDLHECLGHGSGQLLPGTDPDALKAYGNTIEEARADLFGLYYIADQKLVDLGLLPDKEAYRSQYYTYLMNGALTQCMRIKPGHDIEEAHMRNRALIANWVLAHAEGAAEIVEKNGKHYLSVSDYPALRQLFAKLLAEIQRIKSEGDYAAAEHLVEGYGVKIDPAIHQEIRERYDQLNIAPYKGFINPRFKLVKDDKGKVTDVQVDYTESYSEQMLRYSHEYATLV
ncbi:MAG: dipeptidyl peptidase 3 [Prevotella sp.]|jgi:dipeptidyl-peptidase-3|nr:dihydrofolate reductase [Prevotella sp.]MCH3993499.1 dipeptidyl peptidase 3 [Prevotella sp.]